MLPYNIIGVKVYNTDTEYKLAELLRLEQKESDKWHKFSQILIIILVLENIALMIN